MVTIPRYRQRTRVPLGGLSSSADFGPGLGDDLRQAGQALAVAGGIANTVTGLARRQPDRLSDPDRASLRASASDKALLQTQEAVAGWGRAAADTVRSIQPSQDSTALNNPDGSPAQTLEIIARKAARSLPPDLRGAFEAAIAPRQAALSTEAAARTAQAREARGQALSEEIEAQGVEDYLRQADLDETLGRAALASAVAARGARLRSAGVDGAAVREAQRQMLVEVEGGRIARLAASDPDRAAMVMGDREAVLPETVRLELTSAIQAEQLRREARAKVGDLAAGTADLADNLEGLMASSRAAAGDDPARVAAFHGAAIGAWRAARMAREAHEDAAWTKVAPYLSADSGVTAWTDLPGEVWAALSDRQKAAVQGHFEAPWREPDPEVTTGLKALAASDPEAFRDLDMGALSGRLRPDDLLFWRDVRDAARRGDPDWRATAAEAPSVALGRPADGGARLYRVAYNEVESKLGGAGRPAMSPDFRPWRGPGAKPQSDISTETRLLNKKLGQIPDPDGLVVDSKGAFARRVVDSSGLTSTVRLEPVSDAEAQAARERRLNADSYREGLMSPEEKKARGELRRLYRRPVRNTPSLARRQDAAELRASSPEVRAFLRLIAWAEGNTDYNTKVGGPPGERNPRAVWAVHPGFVSGKYQFNTETWNEFGKAGLQFENFSPESQDLTAIDLLRHIGLVEPLLKGDVAGAVNIAAGRWASFPEAKTGVSRFKLPSKKRQPSKKFDELKRLYDDYLREEQQADAGRPD